MTRAACVREQPPQAPAAVRELNRDRPGSPPSRVSRINAIANGRGKTASLHEATAN